MSINYEIIFFAPVVIFILNNLFSFKKRKRTAKSIYKLIDELEKKYIY